MRLLARVTAGLIAAGALLVAVPTPASAHPLGNFTVNRYFGLVVSTDAITVDHVLDLAEIPTAQRVPAIDTSGDGTMSRSELERWAQATCRDAATKAELTVDGSRVPLMTSRAGARALPGQAGLSVLRVECSLRAATSLEGRASVRLVDSAASGDVGWHEVTAVGDGTTLTASDVPAESASKRLTAYPSDLLASPLEVSSASLVVRPGGPALASGDDSARSDAVLALDRTGDRLTSAFEGLLARSDGPLLGLVALLGAIALGAAHAVAPGHGKTIMAFYLSGRRQRALRAAATVGATVTVTHTAGVLALGLLVSAGTAFAPASVYPWLSVVSGLLVVGVGLALLRSARRGGPGHVHGTGPGQHTHTPAHVPAPAHVHPAESLHAASTASALVGVGGPGLAQPLEHGPQEEADHSPGHVHDHGHHHGPDQDGSAGHHHGDDAAPDAGEPSRRGLIAIGLAGGLLPSPSALLVLLAAIGLGRPWFGVALVVAFGVGMAATLAIVGLLVMRLRGTMEARLAAGARRPWASSALAIAPLVTAAAVTVLGAVLAVRGLLNTGLL